MEMVQGRVVFTRTVKPGDYESKSATVELTFTTSVRPETAETETAIAGDMAFRRVMAMVYRADEKQPTSPAEVPVRDQAEAKKSRRKELADVVIDDPPDGHILDDILGEPAPKTVTDEELLSAIDHCNARIRNVIPIRELIAEFCPGVPATVRQIPAEKRAEFVQKLGRL
jgi:hypothetical protein